MFALLEHTTPDGVHWDLLVAVAGQESLRTWRLASNPLGGATQISVQRLPDHRRHYLDFEGEISDGRGQVRRLDRGAAEWIRGDDSTICLRLAGAILNGMTEIVSGADGTGILRFSPAAERAESGGERTCANPPTPPRATDQNTAPD